MAEYKSLYTGEQIDAAIGKASTALQQELEPAFNASASKDITNQNITNWNAKAELSDIPDVSNFITKDVNDLTNYTTTSNMNTAISNAVGTETTNRQNSDVNLQSQIDAITSASDVVDVVGTYVDLQNYVTTSLTADDVIKVLQDSTHNNALSYYRWTITNNVGEWVYVGSEGPFYTKSEADTLLNDKYVKPSTGIPKTDLAQGVQDSLDLADSAVQSTDYGTSSSGGTVKSRTAGNFSINADGLPYAEVRTYEQYSSQSNDAFIGKGTLESVITGKELENQKIYTIESPLSTALDIVNLKKGIYFNQSPNIYAQRAYFKLPSSGNTVDLFCRFVPTVILIVKNASEWTDDTSNGIFCYFIGTDHSNADYREKLLGISCTNGVLSIASTSNFENQTLVNVAQVIYGQKSFNTIPKVSSYTAPTLDTELTAKKYVDDLVGGLGESETYTEIIKTSTADAPFVFSEKNLGIYFFSSNVTTFYTKLTPSGARKSWTENPIMMFYTKNPEGLTNARIGKVIYYSNSYSEDYVKVASLVVYNGSLYIDDNGQDASIFKGTFLTPGPGIQYISGTKKFANIPILNSIKTPTDQKELTPKSYVDNLPTTYSGYDATKTQVLKNINGTLTWVDET